VKAIASRSGLTEEATRLPAWVPATAPAISNWRQRETDPQRCCAFGWLRAVL
jgi:hypothetical protein